MPQPEDRPLDGQRIVVTGGAGFLGRKVVERLEHRGVTALVPRRADVDLTRQDAT